MARKRFSEITNAGLFSAATVTRFAAPSARNKLESLAGLSGSVNLTTGSFDVDSFDVAFKSTQQIPLDWSKFEKHVFFDSAQSKVNVAFDTMINFFPFDSSKEDVKVFLQGLTGYERHLYDVWPKHVGYLNFSGTVPGETGGTPTYIPIVDRAGDLYPTISTRNDGAPVIDLSTNPFSIMFWLHLPTKQNYNSIICQKLAGSSSLNHGFTVGVNADATSTQANVVAMLSSGSTALSASAIFEKGDNFSHCAVQFSRTPGELPVLEIWRNGNMVATSSLTADFGAFDFLGADLNIGSGSAHYLGTLTTEFTPTTTLSGALDDFRIYGSQKNKAQIREIASGSTDIEQSLFAWYKFNEATGSYANNSVVLDSSGNSLHGKISNYKISLRVNNMQDPVVNEAKFYEPVLFPSQPDIVNFNSRLLSSASKYDANNPNLITKLVPQHYLVESAYAEGFQNEAANTGDMYGYVSDFPGGGKVGQPQIIASLLFTWAKFFDEIKLFIDQFGNLLHMQYDDESTTADIMIPFFAKYYGLVLPNMFSGASVQQFLRGQNITTDPGASNSSLAYIQAQIWRRILVNINDVIRSKGTLHAVKSIIRATGIEPDNMFRFREFGGPRYLSLTRTRSDRSEVSSLLQFSSSSFAASPFMSGSRIEIGTPTPKGTMLDKTIEFPHGKSNYRWDGLFTSGSWTVEFLVKPKSSDLITTMSLGRMCTTGSIGEVVLANCTAVNPPVNSKLTGSLRVWHRPIAAYNGSEEVPSLPIEVFLTGTNVFDGNVWHVAYGRKILNDFTASYFLRAGKQNFGNLSEFNYTEITASYHTGNLYQSGSGVTNVSGSFLQFGKAAFASHAGGLNSSAVTLHAKATRFSGSMGRYRFWSKELNLDENREHVRNFKSVGVANPLINYNFVTKETGSFERMRLDVQCDQRITQSSATGFISLFDYSQNNYHFSGSNFRKSIQVINPQQFNFSTLEPKFDERSTDNKIRIAGFQEDVNIKEFSTLKSPVTHIPLGTPVTDDTRFSIEVSSVRALNDDIMLILGTLEFFDDALGSPELMYATDYPDLVALRDVYFKRLTNRVNYKNLLSFYKWIDESVGFLIARMLSHSTNFLGMNFYIESHVLERNKLQYQQVDIYLGENDRRGLQTDLGLQQVVGILRRF